jgi:phage baseplate assembly protein W
MATRFLGMPYPVRKTTKGYLPTVIDIDVLRADLLFLLQSNFGERVMLPEYGTNLRSLVFEPNDPLIEQRARDLITQAINNWEPRVTIDSITITRSPTQNQALQSPEFADENALSISIAFKDPGNITDIQSLILLVPLTGTI